MTRSESSQGAGEWLRLGLIGRASAIMGVVRLCRYHSGRVLFREGSVIVIELCGSPAQLNEFYREAAAAAEVTHLLRSDLPAFVGASRRETRPVEERSFCGV